MTEGKFRIIEGGAGAKPKRARKARSLTPWKCRACIPDIGIATTSLIKVRTDAKEDGQLRLTGGRTIWVCAMCLARGRFTPATA